MQKAVEVAVRVYVEGEAEATADFAAVGKRVVAEALRLGGRRMPGYRFTIRGLSVDDDPPDPPATA
ncbi:MAG TPA: hypothetical protein VG370_24070 [Chloroflexota bacterium]|jgi:hypothetical protein|nr:hypothetical protein [Chloroflexota bacterium]